MNLREPDEPILGHIHVPKCAGTSVRVVLDEIWGDDHIFLYVDGPTTFVYSRAELEDALHGPTVKAFSSHFVRTFPKQILGRSIFYVTFLRDPLEQWISYLTYTRKVYRHIADQVLLKHLPPDMPNLSLRECAEWLLAQSSTTFLNFRENYTTNFFARYTVADAYGYDYADPRYRAIRLPAARQTLGEFFFVGIAESLEDSLRLLRRKLAGSSLAMPEIPVPALNLSHEARDDLSWLTPSDPLGRRCLESLREDLALYRWARARFERELAEECAQSEFLIECLQQALDNKQLRLSVDDHELLANTFRISNGSVSELYGVPVNEFMDTHPAQGERRTINSLTLSELLSTELHEFFEGFSGRLRSQMDQANEPLEALASSLQAVEAERDRLRAECGRATGELAALTPAYEALVLQRDAMLRSRSWRLTAPFRSIALRMRRKQTA